MMQAGRPFANITFDAPGVEPTNFRVELLNKQELEESLAAAYQHAVKMLGKDLRGRPEDTDIYDQRIVVEMLHRMVKDPDDPIAKKEGVVDYYRATRTPDDYFALTGEQITYLYNQCQVALAKFTPSKAQQLAFEDLPEFCRRCATAQDQDADGDDFLFLASFSWLELLTMVGTLGAALSPYLTPYPTLSESPDSSESSASTSTDDTISAAPSDSGSLSSFTPSEAAAEARQQQKDSQSSSLATKASEIDEEAARAAAAELAKKFTE
jgi:hypothetical protein